MVQFLLQPRTSTGVDIDLLGCGGEAVTQRSTGIGRPLIPKSEKRFSEIDAVAIDSQSFRFL
jgi:hypothetical protein